MPLLEGTSQKIVNSNVKELVHSGYKPNQAIAIAISKKQEELSKKRDQ